MRSRKLWWYELRRAGWTALVGPPIGAALGVVAAVASARTGQEETTARILLGGLEMAVPLAAGVACASLIGRDPAVELQLSAATPYRSTLLRRMAATLAWTAVVAVTVALVLIASGWWARWPANHGPFTGQLTWLAPTVGLGSLGFAAAAVFRSPATAGALVTALWALQQFLGGVAQQHRPGRLLYLFATTRGAVPGDWVANRLSLLGTAAGLTAVAVLVLGRSERLIDGQDES